MNRDPGRDFQVVGLAADGVDGARQGPLRQAIRRCPGDMIAQVQPQSQGGEKIPFHTSPHINAQQIAGPQHCPDLAGKPLGESQRFGLAVWSEAIVFEPTGKVGSQPGQRFGAVEYRIVAIALSSDAVTGLPGRRTLAG